MCALSARTWRDSEAQRARRRWTVSATEDVAAMIVFFLSRFVSNFYFFCCVPLSDIAFFVYVPFPSFIFLLRSASQPCIFVYVPFPTCFLTLHFSFTFHFFNLYVFCCVPLCNFYIFVYVPFFKLYFFCCVPLFKFAILFPSHLKHRLFGIQCSIIHMRRCLVSLA